MAQFFVRTDGLAAIVKDSFELPAPTYLWEPSGSAVLEEHIQCWIQACAKAGAEVFDYRKKR